MPENGSVGPKTKVSLGFIGGALLGAVTVFSVLYYWRAYEIAGIRAEQDLVTQDRRDLKQAREDILGILRWQAEHSDFSADSTRAFNVYFETLRLSTIQSLEYQQRDAETKHLRPPMIPGRLYEPMLLPTPSGIHRPINNSLRDLIRDYEARRQNERETSQEARP